VSLNTFDFINALICQPTGEVITSIKVFKSRPIINPALYNDIICGPALILARVGSLALSVDNDNKAENYKKASSILLTCNKASLTLVGNVLCSFA
jgi:hypothetical protein